MQKMRNESKDLRHFGEVLAFILIIFGAIQFLKHRILLSEWLAASGLIIICASLIKPLVLKPVYAVFLKVTHAIGWFNTRVILVVIYFVVITPIAVVIRIFGKDPLDRKIIKQAHTYWVKRPADRTDKVKLERQF